MISASREAYEGILWGRLATVQPNPDILSRLYVFLLRSNDLPMSSDTWMPPRVCSHPEVADWDAPLGAKSLYLNRGHRVSLWPHPGGLRVHTTVPETH